MLKKRFRSKVALSLVVGVPLAAVSIAQVAAAGGFATLLDRNGNTVLEKLSDTDTITMKDINGNDVLYKAGPAYSPKKTCGACHDYTKITKAYHFMQGVGPDGSGVSDTWSSENQDGTEYKYLANAYGHILSGGQYGAW